MPNEVRVPIPEGVKLIIEATKPTYGRKLAEIEVLYINDLETLNPTKWDGYRLSSIKIIGELTTQREARILMEFLNYHQYCLWDERQPRVV
jgi:hypothetical protein